MRTPRHSLELVGHYIMEDDYEISAKMLEGSGRPMEAYINLSPSRKNLKIQVDYESSKSFIKQAFVFVSVCRQEVETHTVN